MALLGAGGRFVAFASLANNLVAGDTNGVRDVFVKDLQSGAVGCVSRSRSGEWGDGESVGTSISADGQFVVFTSFAGNLVGTDRNRCADVYWADRTTGELELISAGPSGVSGDGPSGGGQVSDDGRWVTYYSYADDLTAGALRTEARWYLLDRLTHTLRPVNELVGSMPVGLLVRYAAVSADARWLTLAAGSPRGGSGPGQMLVFDRVLGQLRVVSSLRDGVFGDAPSFPGAGSANGRFLTFESGAANLRLS